MNKLRLIRIFELRGKIHPIEQYVIDILDGIQEVADECIIRYWKDDTFYFNYYPQSNNIWVSSYLGNVFYTKYGCSYDEIIEINKYLLEKHLNITINNVLYYE